MNPAVGGLATIAARNRKVIFRSVLLLIKRIAKFGFHLITNSMLSLAHITRMIHDFLNAAVLQARNDVLATENLTQAKVSYKSWCMKKTYRFSVGIGKTPQMKTDSAYAVIFLLSK